MNKTRWLLFLLVGFPIQLIVFALYPLAWLYWRLFVVQISSGDKQIATHEDHTPAGADYRAPDNLFINNVDDHGAFSMYGALSPQALSKLILNGNPVRRVNEDGSINQWQVSGDVLVSWLFATTYNGMDEVLKDDILKVASVYLKNLGVQSFDDINKGDVSNRCNNFGVNYCPDSESLKLGQPMAGPQFYTSSAIFALASKHSKFFKVVFWIHWLLLGGWYWAWAPTLWSKKTQLIYVRDISMKALYIQKYVHGNRWWIRRPMEIIAYRTTNIRNDLWYALMGQAPTTVLPKSMDSFFSQKEDFTSRLSDRMNGYLGPAITSLAQQALELNKK